MEFLMGSAILFGGNFAPKEWAFCQGQLLAISQNQALYAILGTTWGGDGRTTFGLPDLSSRVPIGAGSGPGLSRILLGQMGGYETNTLTIAQMPLHSHEAVFTGSGGSSDNPLTAKVTVNANSGAGDHNDAEGHYWASPKLSLSTLSDGSYSTTANTTMATDAVEVTVTGGGGGITGGTVNVQDRGESKTFSVMQPVLGINYILCIQGLFPSRN